MVVSVVVCLRNTSISRLGGFRSVRRSRKLIHPLLACVGLSFMFVFGIWFMCVLMRSWFVRLVSHVIKMSSTCLV